MKTTAIIGFAAVFFACVAVKSFTMYLDAHKSVTRLTDDLKATQETAEYFKARNGDQAVKISSQELTIKELRKTLPDAIDMLKNLYIAPRQLISYTQSTTETKERIVTTLRDSIVTDTIKISLIDYTDKWFSIEGTIKGDTAKLDIRSRDEIKVVNYMSRRPHPWLWIFGGRRHPQCLISNMNPHNHITIEKSVMKK